MTVSTWYHLHLSIKVLCWSEYHVRLIWHLFVHGWVTGDLNIALSFISFISLSHSIRLKALAISREHNEVYSVGFSRPNGFLKQLFLIFSARQETLLLSLAIYINSKKVKNVLKFNFGTVSHFRNKTNSVLLSKHNEIQINSKDSHKPTALLTIYYTSILLH